MKLLSNSIKTNSLWGQVKHHRLQILKSHTWQQWMLTDEHYCLIHQFLHFMSTSIVPSAFILPGTFFLLNFDENQFIHHCLGVQLSLLQTASLCPRNEWPEPLSQSPAHWPVSPCFSVSQDTLEWLSSVSAFYLQLTPTYWVTNLWKRPKNFSSSYSSSYGITHEAIGMSWGRDIGAIVIDNMRIETIYLCSLFLSSGLPGPILNMPYPVLQSSEAAQFFDLVALPKLSFFLFFFFF